jgi:hypothetical protein
VSGECPGCLDPPIIIWLGGAAHGRVAGLAALRAWARGPPPGIWEVRAVVGDVDYSKRIYFVDVAIPADRKRRRRGKTHIVFDGGKIFRVRKLTELEDAVEVYVDSIFPQIHEELIELIERGVKVFLLKNTRILKRLREENGVEKSDEADARLLSVIPKDYFKQLTAREIRLLKLIWEYEMYVKWRKIIRQWAQIHPSSFLKESARRLRCIANRYARKIIEEVKSNEGYATTYRLTCDMLGVRDSVEVAILVAKLPLNWRLSRLKGLLGLTPHKNKNYNRKLRAHLSRLAVNVYLNNKRCRIGADLLKDLEDLPPKKAIYKLQLRIVRTLKKAWRQRQKQRMLAGGQ